MPNGASSVHGTRPLWRQTAYLTWLVSDTGVGLAAAVQAFVVPLVVIAVTGDAALAGLVAALGMGASMLSMLAGGVLADRHDLRVLMMLSAGSGALLLGLMALAQAAGLGVLALGVLNALAGVRSGLLGVASDAALKQVVAPAQLPSASSANQARDTAITLGGGPLGGALLALGPVVALAATAGGFVVAALAALGLRGDFRADRGGEAASGWREAWEGVRWLWEQHVVRRILLVSLLLNLGLSTALTTLVYDLAVQGVTPARIGLVSTAIGAGMLVGALGATWVVARFPVGVVATAGMALAGLAVVTLPWVPGFWPVLAVLGVGLLGAPAVNAGMMSYFMHLVPRRVLGRALSGASLLTSGAVPLAPVLAGLGLGWWGARPTLVTAGAFCLAAVLLVLTDRGLRSLPKPSEWETGEPPPSP